MRIASIAFLATALGGCTASAETVVFKNQDRLTGSWERVADGKLVLKTEALGAVSIPVAQVASFASAGVGEVLLRSGRTIRGRLALTPSGDWTVHAEDGVHLLPSASVESIVSRGAPRPGPRAPWNLAAWREWKGTANLGYSLVRGDRQAGTLSFNLRAGSRPPEQPGVVQRWRTDYSLGMLLVNTRAASNPRVSANSLTTSLRQDYLVNPSSYLFGLVQFEHIQPQSLELRQIYGLGLGRDVWQRRSARLSLLGGVTLVRERLLAGDRRQRSEALVGERLNLAAGKRLRIAHQFSLYPNLNIGGAYRFETNSSIGTPISPRMAINVNLIHRYLSRVLPGQVKSETQITTGLGFQF